MTGTIDAAHAAAAGRAEMPVSAGRPRLLQDKVRMPRMGFAARVRRATRHPHDQGRFAAITAEDIP
jgi:hypothetical protein